MRRVGQDVGECIFATTSASWCSMPHSPTNFKAPFSPLCLSSFAFSLTARSPLLSSPRFHFPFSLAFTSHFYHIPFSFPSLSLSIHNLFLTCSIYLLVGKSEFLPYCVIKDVYHAKSHRIHEKHLDIATSRFQPSPLARVVRVYTPVKFIFLYCCPVKVFLMIKIRLKPSCRISASFVTLLVGKKILVT